MVSIDDSRWPIVSARFEGAGTMTEMNQFYTRFETWLAKQEPFALVVQRNNAEEAEKQGKRSPEAKQMRQAGMDWIKAHKPQISQYCAGVAMVPDSAKLVKVWGPMVGAAAKTMYGCPGKVFGSTEEAKVWATERLDRAKATVAGASSLKPLILKRKVALALSGILAAVGAALGLVPYYLIYLVSLRLFDGAVGTSVSGLGASYIWQLAWIAVGAVVGKGICMGLSTRLSHIAAYTILYDLRIELAQKLGSLPLGYFTQRTTGSIKKIIHEDVEQLEQGLAHIIPDVVAGVTVPLLAGILLLLVDWRMTLATLASAAIALGLFGFMMSRFDMSAYNALMAKMNGIVIQYINGMKVIKAFTRTDASFGQLQDVIEEMRQVYIPVMRTFSLPMAVMLTLMRSAAITVIPVGIALYLMGTLSLPTFVLFVVMGIGFNRPIMAVLFHGFTGFYQVNQASQRIAEVFNQPELADPLNPEQPKMNSIAFRNVSFSYGDRRADGKVDANKDSNGDRHGDSSKALTNISFKAPAGKVTALVGPSGAGKSTIAKLIPRFWDVDEGTVTIGRVDVKAIAVEDLMNRVSFVFQDVFLFNDTVLENIRIGKPDATRAEIIAAAKAARCHEFIETLPQGYDTSVGENGAMLSGGQRQRLSIARAILKDSPIIVLDEATAYVDPENEALVQEALASLLAGHNKTLIVIAHRLSTITRADQILVIDQGQIVARGTHETLLDTCDLYRMQWQSHITAQTWQFGSNPPPANDFDGHVLSSFAHPTSGNENISETASISEVDQPLENPYLQLDETDGVWTMMRKLIPARADHYFWKAVRWRICEGMAIGSTSYVIYLVLVELFQASQVSSSVSNSIATGVANSVDSGQLWGYVALIVALCVAQIVCGYKANVQAYGLTIAVQTRLRLFLADYIRRLPLGFFTQRDTGTVDALFTTNIMYLEPHHVLESLINAVVTPIMIFLVMLAYDWRLALVLASSVPFALLALRYGEGVFARVWRIQAETRVKANARMVEYIQGIAVIRAFNLAGDRLHQFRTGLKEYRTASLRTVTEIVPALTIFLAVLELGFALLLVVGAAFVANGSLTGDRFLFFMVLGLAFYAPLIAMSDMMELYRIMQNCVRNLNEFVRSPMLPTTPTPQQPNDTTIEFKDVSFSYGEEKVLDQVNLTIPPGSITALVGPSGSGKTTITNLIARFWDVDQGSVTLGGADVRQIPSNTLLEQITMVFQDVYLFNDTIFENIRFGNPNATESQVIAAAQAARCHEFINQLPDGYHTMVGEGGATLSGGEKQRISIARALLKDAPIVLLDEATASIDPENERLIQQAFQALSLHKTLVIIAHRLTTIAAADQILVLDQGRVVERGTHDMLMVAKGLYQHLWDVKARSHGWKIVQHAD